MISSNQLKFVRSLHQKKFREEHRCFIAEGDKLVLEMIDSAFRVSAIYALEEWIAESGREARKRNIPVVTVNLAEMERITTLSTPSPVLAVVEIPGRRDADLTSSDLILALDDIRDPGNMGTIIRTADWFGINTILCSPMCVDQYHPKVVQSTMGSIARISMITCDLSVEIQRLRHSGYEICGTFMEGEPVYQLQLSPRSVIIIGNESRGISPEIESLVTQRLFIPSYGNAGSGRAESLNASVAAAIICAEFRRQAAQR